MKFQVVLETSDEGGYTVYVPSLPGCISEGDTVDEAMRNTREAIRLYLEPVEDDFVMDEHSLVENCPKGWSNPTPFKLRAGCWPGPTPRSIYGVMSFDFFGKMCYYPCWIPTKRQAFDVQNRHH